jgi:hypothetical protein
MENERVVGLINNQKVYFDGFIHYVKTNGMMLAVDVNKIKFNK